MGFIFLLLLSLGALTRVSIESASQAELQSRAEQNAMAGLYVALGELQRYAGPDQRATATANIASDTNNLPEPVAGTGYWTGVWGNANNPNDSSAARAPRLLNWLVSGNEGLALQASTATGDFGRITTPGANWTPSVEPDDATAVGSGASATDDFQIGSLEARMLVGPKTAGTGNNAQNRYVIAPLVKMNSNTAASGSATALENRYAYWIGDESVKARINLVNPWPQSGVGASEARKQRIYSFSSAQRVAGDKIDGLASLPTTALPANNLVGDVVEMQQVGMLPDVGGAAAAEHFHDVSVHSRSVLADVRRGGLKRDLTSILRSGGGSSEEADNRFIYPDENGSYTSGDPFYKKPPTWGLLRDFARFENTIAAAIVPQTPTATRQGLSPVLLYGSMFYAWNAQIDSGDPTLLHLSVYASPRFMLWNPYSRPIRSGTYEIGFLPPRKDDGSDKGLAVFTITESSASGTVTEVRNFSMGKGEFVGSASDMERRMLRFRINMTRNWNPGEVVAFSLPTGTQGALYEEGVTTLVAVPVMDRVNYMIDNYLLMADELITITPDTALNPVTRQMSIGTGLRRSGEISMYLGEEGAGSSGSASAIASAAHDPGNTNRFYQWIGRVEPSHNVDGIAGGVVNVEDIDVPLLDSSDNPMQNEGLINYEIYHKQGIAAQYMPALPVRWIAAGNARAYMQGRTGLETGNLNRQVSNPNYTGFTGSFAHSTASVPMANIRNTPGGEATFGNDFNNSSYSDRIQRPMLFELPSNESPLMSVADLRHAALGGHGTSPAYPVGNAIADFRIGKEETHRDVAASSYPDPSGIDPGGEALALFDQSWLLNDALWDRYFFSTLPTTGSLSDTLPNSRHTVLEKDGIFPVPADLNDTQGRNAAANILLEGGFNVNSTSVEAWRAVLAGLDGLAYNPQSPSQGGASALMNPFSRFRQSKGGSNRSGLIVNNAIDYWSGYRQLTNEQLDGLAERVVQQVKERGPFLSLSDFVNRALDGDDPYMLKGALQAAIDDEAAGVNNKGNLAINFAAETASTDGGGRHLDAYTTAEGQYGYDSAWSNDYDMKAYLGWNSTTRNQRNNPFTRMAAFAPGDVTQSDVLAAIGATLTARSDTFVIRSYGEVVDPRTNTVSGRAWCEAVVQRLPDYVNATNAAQDEVSALGSENSQFGRRFVVTSFRWLNADDI